MIDRSRHVLTVLLAALAGGCSLLQPPLPQAQPDVAAEWPLPAATAPAAPGAATAASGVTADIGWRDFFVDEHLEELIARALANNRDLRVAILDVQRAQAEYRVRRSDRVPSFDATGALARTGGSGPTIDAYTAGLTVTSYELDLFGRVASQSKAALESYLAQDEARRAAQLSLVAEVANAYLTLAADREQVALAKATLRTREEAHVLTEKRHDLGAVSALDVNQSRTQVESARAEVARYEGQAARDLHALVLLVGGPIEPALLPTDFANDVTGLGPLPAGLPSDVLLRRPDVMQAEHRLRAANANIGAARAAFFPSITLTGSVGYASTDLSDLFDGGTVWSFVPRVNVPIFEGGRLKANLDIANTDRDIALAQYEGTIQQGFREVSDSLALTGTLAEQRSALQALVDAALRAETLAQARYAAGRDSYLVRLEAQRTLYVAQQALIATRLAEQANRVTLYKVLGGGWREQTP